MGARLASFVIWAAVAACVAFWGLRLGGRPMPVPAHASVAAMDGPAAGSADLTRLFGAVAPPPAPTVAAAPPPPQDSRFKLLGVVAQRRAAPSEGLALISLDGQAPKAYGQGAVVDGQTVVLTVRHRRVELGPRGGPVQLTLELAALPEAARGTLPGVAGLPAAPPAMPGVPGGPMAAGGMPPRLVAPPPVVVQPPPQQVVPEPDGLQPRPGMPQYQGGVLTQ